MELGVVSTSDVPLAEAFHSLGSFRALVIGDFVLDTYTLGRVKRISPEAPVPVLEAIRQESRPGGAGNVVLNLLALGGKVKAVGRIGDDLEGKQLLELLEKAGAESRGLLVSSHYRTPIKNRLIAESQQLLRVDFEKIEDIASDIEARAIAHLEEEIKSVQIVALSDYGKGFLSRPLIAKTIEIAKCFSVPCIVDPKGIAFTKYRGATLLKPNLGEAYAAAKMGHHTPLEQVAECLFDMAEIEQLMITKSEMGISLFNQKGERSDFPVRSKEVRDVTGAGDTVLAVVCLGLANGLTLQVAVQLANIAAGIAIERLGCVQVRLSEIAERLLETDCQTKIFDRSHTFALQQVLREKKYSLLVLEKTHAVTGDLLRAVRRIGEDSKRALVLYFPPPQPAEELLHLFSSLQEVKAILLQKESFQTLCESTPPEEILFFNGKEVSKKDLSSLTSV